MEATLEISLLYAKRGIDAILDARNAFEDNVEMVQTSSNTIEFIQDEEDEDFNLQDEINYILLTAYIPGDEYWWS